MPITSQQITLGTAGVLIVPSYHNAQTIQLHNHTKSSNEYIFVGGSGVTSATGIHIDPGEDRTIEVPPGDELWAASDPDGLVVGILVVKR